jgi:hypothetical protein
MKAQGNLESKNITSQTVKALISRFKNQRRSGKAKAPAVPTAISSVPRVNNYEEFSEFNADEDE